MIIWKSKEELEDRPNFPCEKFRWIFEISIEFGNSQNNKYKNIIINRFYNLWKNFPYFYIGFVHQHKFPNNEKWYSNHATLYGISITNYFKLGIEHTYYDGPHCSLSIGFFHILWSGNPKTNWCKKCAGE